MKKEAFFLLVDKVNKGTASDEELDLYNRYFNRFQNKQDWDEREMGVEATRGQLLYQSIDQAIGTPVPIRKLNAGWRRAAAIAAMLIVMAGIATWFFQKDQYPVAGQLVLKTNAASSTTNNLIQLPDGSTVILSSGSKLRYAPSFKGRAIREVFLSGKAFFDVKHIRTQPFIVRTGKVKTQVLGTAFDVDARSRKVTVTVIRGKVVVNTETRTLATLTPNKQVSYDEETDLAKLSNTNAKETVSWREKDLVFNDITMSNAAMLLQDRFNVKVQIEDEQLAGQKFSTTLFENQSLQECLTLICDFNNAVFKYNSTTKQITIKPKN